MMKHRSVWLAVATTILLGSGLSGPARIGRADGVLEYGNENLLNTGTYSSDPKAGSTLEGLATDVVTTATNSFSHNFPFSPSAGDFAGTDQIYVGSVQTGAHDGYSTESQRINGPMAILLDYSTLVPAGSTITSLTLGMAADDFQFPTFGQPFLASLNGTVEVPLSAKLNFFNQTGPMVQFFTIGINPSILTANNQLSLSINEAGDGGDGFAADFFTVGVTTQSSASAVPTPTAFGGGVLVLGMGAVWALIAKRQPARS